VRATVKAILLVLVAAASLAACERSISVEDYRRDCLQNDECMLILVGPVCSCDCEFGAINQEDGGKYFEDRGDVECDEQCSPCGPIEAWCESGTCAVREPIVSP